MGLLVVESPNLLAELRKPCFSQGEPSIPKVELTIAYSHHGGIEPITMKGCVGLAKLVSQASKRWAFFVSPIFVKSRWHDYPVRV